MVVSIQFLFCFGNVTLLSTEIAPNLSSFNVQILYYRSEQLLVSVNMHTGSFIVHVPQFDPSPSVVTEIQQVLNSMDQNMEKLRVLLSQLR